MARGTDHGITLKDDLFQAISIRKGIELRGSVTETAVAVLTKEFAKELDKVRGKKK